MKVKLGHNIDCLFPDNTPTVTWTEFCCLFGNKVSFTVPTPKEFHQGSFSGTLHLKLIAQAKELKEFAGVDEPLMVFNQYKGCWMIVNDTGVGCVYFQEI